MINIVTGYQGKPHLEAAEQGLFNAGICGNAVVLPTNNRFAYTLNSNNSITISSGDLVNQGRHITIPYNSSETLTIENGKTGFNRIDTIVVRYIKNSETAVESSEVLVIKGTAVTDNQAATPPEINRGNIFGGAVQDDFPLYDIHINGLNIEQVVPRFNIIMSAEELTEKSQKTAINNAVTACINSDYKLTESNNDIKLNVSLNSVIGDGLSIEDGSIKIGANISKVLVCGSLYFKPAGYTYGKTIAIYHNSTPVAAGYIHPTNNYIISVNTPAKLIDVNEGDTISLYADGDENDVIISYDSRTYLTVQSVG